MGRRPITFRHLLTLCISGAFVLFFGPFYFQLPSPQTQEVDRRVLHEVYQKNKVIAPCDEEIKLCGKDSITKDGDTRGSDNGDSGPLAVFKDGIVGNYEKFDPGNRTGPGEYGEPVITEDDEKTKAEMSAREFGFNMVNSDKIAMDRALPDIRLKECRYWHYPEALPTTSVIIVFHNEGWSTLLRTVHSVINTSPTRLLKEVILVDDDSDTEHLKEKLDLYLKQFDGLVRLYRNDEREGLIRSRIKGALLATADVILFLDAHCECNKNWLPPLLTRIAHDRTIMAVPIIDGIDWTKYTYRSNYYGTHFRGIFEWSLYYKESLLPGQEEGRRNYRSEPYRSPTHAGGLFAMDRKYFFELGAYDPGLEIWGGENFELSFKIWQCGGSIEWVPCSRIGHIYRHYSIDRKIPMTNRIPLHKMNYMRVVEVWFDEEHKEHFYRLEPWLRGAPLENLQPQLEFRRKHNCKSFKWFMDNVAIEVLERFPPPPQNVEWGQIRPWYTDQCWTEVGDRKIALIPCASRPYRQGQFFRLDVNGKLGLGERCVLHTDDKTQPQISRCPENPKGSWEYIKDTQQIRSNAVQMCIHFDEKTSVLFFKKCDRNSHDQKWIFKQIYMWM
ncbi:N-acetylgalactosaminyltransferase 7-like [Haliotis rufescens]|uniref:N-acetylgalactosaminyltransferase 7-like n=1 Tax=Haliotis rufescens TaxID=6454 RepID=UPI00201F7AD2|nr:N-acetylgalactosaminyltransferase 7-like [Haliotis rufescens]